MSDYSIPLYVGTADPDSVNPWHVCDGRWGGFGPQLWHRAHKYGFKRKDVVEIGWKDGKEQWVKIWIDVDKKWRSLTQEELAHLPELKRPTVAKFDKPINWPLAFKDPKTAEAIARVLAQPVLNVIEQAPILKNVFGKSDTTK